MYFFRERINTHFTSLHTALTGNVLLTVPWRALRFLAQVGQPDPRVRLAIMAIHSLKQTEHTNQAFCFVWGRTMPGVTSPFLVGCHSAAMWGLVVDRLYSGVANLPAQYGQFLPRTRACTLCLQVCSLAHLHHTIVPVPHFKESTSNPVLREMSTSLKRSGRAAESLVPRGRNSVSQPGLKKNEMPRKENESVKRCSSSFRYCTFR